MMNEFQRRILAEAAKFGGSVTSKNEQMAKAINEAPLFATGGGGAIFGYSKQQFEAKMRQLIQKMGFEKGINKMDVSDKKMMLYFANAAKARDFIITFNGLTKRQATGSPASINTSFDKVKAPAGTNAIVTVDFSMLKTEGLDNESHMFLMLESLHEQYITEGGVKAAIEDFMYDMLTKQAIAELKPIMKNQSVRGADLRNKVTAVLKKHKVPLMHLGGSSAQLVIDYFDTFHGESVEEQGETIEEGVRMMAGAEKMVKDDPIGGSSMISSLRAAKKSLEGKPTGSVLVVTKEKSPESMSIKVYAPSDFASLTKGLTKKPEAKVGSKGSWSGGEVTVVAIKEEVEVAEQFKAGDKVKVPHKGKMVSGKIVRYDDGGTDKARQHGGGYVVDVGEPASVLVPKQKVQKEEDDQLDEAGVAKLMRLALAHDKAKYGSTRAGITNPEKAKRLGDALAKMKDKVRTKQRMRNFAPPSAFGMKEEIEIDEAKVKYLTGPGKKDSKRLIGIYTMGGKWVKDMNSENEAKAFVNKSWGESVEEDGEELTEAQQVIGKYRFTSFVEGSLKGWLISVQNKGEVGFIEEPAKKNTRTSIAPHKVFFNTKQQGNPKLVLTAFPDSTTRFVGDKEMRFAPRQLLKAVAMWMDKHGMSMVESFDISEVWWKGTDTLSKSDADGLLDDLEKAYEKGGLNGNFKVPNGDSGPVWEMIQGLEDFLRGEPKNMVAYVLKGVKDFLKPEDRNNSKIKAVFESFTEAYAPLDTKGIVGAFTEATKKKRFEYRNSTDSWGKSHGLPHEVCVSYGGDRKEQWRAANVKGTVCYIAVDEGADGKPVMEKWAIRNHVKYVKAEETEQEGEVIEEQDRVAVQGSKMVYVGQRLRALQSKSMMSGSVVKGENYKVATNAKGKVDLVHQAIGYRTAVRNVDATTIEALIKDRVLT